MRPKLGRSPFPLAVATIAALFLGLFFLLPVLKVFGASVFDAVRPALHVLELPEHAVGPLLHRRSHQQPDHCGRGGHRHGPDRRAVCLLPGAAADRRQAGTVGAGRPAAGAAVLRRRLRAGAAVRPRRPRNRLAARHRHSVRVDLRHRRHGRRLRADALSLRRAAGHRRFQVGRRLGRGGRAKSRLLARAGAAHGDAAAGAAVDAGRRAAGVHRGAGEFRRPLRARRGQDDPVGRGLQVVRRRDRGQSGLGRRARRAAGRLHGRGAHGPARGAVAAPLCDRRPALGAAVAGQSRAAPPRRRLLLDRRRCGNRAVRRRRRDLVHAIQWPGAAFRPVDRQFHAAVPALVPAAHQHAAAGDAGGVRRHADRRADRLHRRAPSLPAVGADRRGGDVAVRRRRNRARDRPGHGLQQRLSDPDRHRGDHGDRLHGAQAAVLGALGRRDPAADRSRASKKPRSISACRRR